MPRVVKMAVVGLGHSGRFYIDMLNKFEAIEIMALVDPNENELDRTDKVLQDRPKPRRYSTVESMLRHLGTVLDAVIIATPPRHREIIYPLLDWKARSIALFCSAPLCLNASTAVRINTAVEQSKQIIVVDHWRTTYAVEALKQYLPNLGDILRVSVFGQGGHAHRVEIVRSGRYLSVAFELAGAANDCYPVCSINGGQSVIGHLTTVRGIPMIIDFQAGKNFDAGRLCIEFLGSNGRARLIGAMLEQLYYTSHPFDSVAETDFGLSGAWFQIPIDSDEIVAVRTKDLARANQNPLLNPSFANMEDFLRLVRREPNVVNPFPVQSAVPIARVLQTLLGATTT